MKASELKDFIGKRCDIVFLNRKGDITTRKLDIQDITYVPLYGEYLIGDTEDICLDRIRSVRLMS